MKTEKTATKVNMENKTEGGMTIKEIIEDLEEFLKEMKMTIEKYKKEDNERASNSVSDKPIGKPEL
jgi:CHASE3 domain sensor protein